MKRVVTLLLALASFAVASAAEKITSMREVRDMAKSAKVLTVEDDINIEGFIVSKYNGRNNEMNVNVHYASMKNYDLSTGYIESLSGDIGFRLSYAERPEAMKFPRYAKVVLSLKGATLRCEQEPLRVTIEGVTEANIVRIEQCSEDDMPRKAKYIADLTDDDVYTYVTLKDCEILFKDGSFSNVYERYVQQTNFNKKIKPNKTMDCWATLICDKKGSSIYALTNTLCTWRRDGAGVPQGAGEMKGILAYTTQARYGGDVFGRYVLRPVDKEDYAMAWEAKSALYKSIAEWNWSDNKKMLNTDAGELESVTNERVMADIGKGSLKVMVKGEAIRGRDTNNTRVDAGKVEGTKGFGGFVRYGALSIKTEAHNWWNWKDNRGEGVELQFSTKGLSGERLIVGFTFAAGEISAETSYGFPVFWNVEYSTDGKKWSAVEGAPKKMRSLPWYWHNNVNGCHYDSVLAGAGYTEHMVVLPKSLFGKSKVYVRVVPVAKNYATLGYDYAENGALRPNTMIKTVVNFGSLVVRYN